MTEGWSTTGWHSRTVRVFLDGRTRTFSIRGRTRPVVFECKLGVVQTFITEDETVSRFEAHCLAVGADIQHMWVSWTPRKFLDGYIEYFRFTLCDQTYVYALWEGIIAPAEMPIMESGAHPIDS